MTNVIIIITSKNQGDFIMDKVNIDNKIKILLVDDHPFFRRGICLYFEAVKNIEITAEADSGQKALNLISKIDHDVILMDLQMPGMDGIETSKKVLNKYPDTKILVLSSFNNWDRVYKALQAGVDGYILKEANPSELTAAIKAVAAGGNYFDTQITNVLLQNITNTKYIHSDPNLIEQLTKRELEVLKLVGQGLSNKEIAEKLYVSEKTIKTHTSNIFSKLQVKSRTQAALYAVKQGIIN